MEQVHGQAHDPYRRLARRVLLGCAALMAIAGAAPGQAKPIKAAKRTIAAGQTWHIDCGQLTAGDGTMARPFNALAAVGGRTLGPNDRILLRRGTRCAGELTMRGNGAPGRPIVIGAYGPAGAPLPRIDADGGNAAVTITNQSHIVVQDLELTNGGKPQGLHRGLLLNADRGVVSDLTVRRLNIHDVEGDNAFATGKPGGGIICEAKGAGRFANLLIEGNRIRNASRSGIFCTGTSNSARPAYGQPWPAASTGVIIRGNALDRIQGDGVVVLGTVDALLERNVVRHANQGGFSHNSPQRNCAAGIWAWNANGTVIQHNEVTDTKFGPTETEGCDGTGYDVDFNQDGTIVQYNISMRNEGGFILFCADKSPHRALVRYNLSIDDGSLYSAVVCGASASRDPAVTNLREIKVYNNTFVAPTPRIIPQRDPEMMVKLAPYTSTLEFRNNIVTATEPGPQNEPFNCGEYCTNNLFFNMPPHGSAAVSGDPGFLNPHRAATGAGVAEGYRLRAGSPAARKGVPIPTEGLLSSAEDYFGKRIAMPPSIGFAEPAR